MPRYELVEGKSSKFWEVEVEGKDLHLAWGRIGTNGQEKTKSFASSAAAEAERDKLIQQKTKKGYSLVSGTETKTAAETETETETAAETETTETATETDTATGTETATETARATETSAVAGPEEEGITFSPAWRRLVHPRRGHPSASFLGATPSAEESWKKIHASWVGRMSETWTAPEPERLTKAFAFLAAQEPPTPEDAAVQGVVGRLLGFKRAYNDKPITAPLVDFWMATKGPAFATHAAFRTLEMRYGSGTELRSRAATPASNHWIESAPTVFPRLRARLASVDDAQYAEAREVAAGYRALGDDARAAAAFVFPTEKEWVDASVAELTGSGLDFERKLVVSSLTRADQLEPLFIGLRAFMIVGRWRGPNQLPSLCEGLGEELTPFVLRWLGEEYLDADTTKELYEALAILPGQTPLDALLDRLSDKYVLPIAMEAVLNRPRRATRMLSARIAARGKNVDGAKRLLTTVIAKMPEVVDAVRGELPEGQQAAIAEIEASRVQKPPADVDSLPEILVAPPWSKKTKRPKLPVIKDVTPLRVPSKMSWAPGEKEKWQASHRAPGYATNASAQDWETHLSKLRAGTLPMYYQEMLLVGAPDAVAAEAVTHWVPKDPWYIGNFFRAAIARHELALYSSVAYFVREHLKDGLAYIGPFDIPELAPYVADAFIRLKSARNDAMTWMLRHPEATAVGVIPEAVGRAGKKRRAGEAALRFLKSEGHEGTVLKIAADYGDEVRGAVEQILAIDPKDVLPKKLPTMPSFWEPSALPAPLLADRERSLPPSAIEHVGIMLAMSKPGEEYPGLDDVLAVCDRESLARFAWAVFEAWQAAGHPAKEGWAFTALAIFGDDEVARRLTPLIRRWPGDGGHARAVTGLDVLTAIGSDVALMHLHGIAQKVKFKGLQKNAKEKIAIIAQERNLTPEELADRLVPDLGLEDDGSMVLDYGPRQFTVGFDEHLKPFVLADGKPRKSLPKPGAKDDPEKAPAAYKRFSALKKDAKTAAKSQILRLELAMVGQRRWSGAQLRRFFLEHPLMIHLSRRLLWARYDEAGAVTETFRVAEDGSLASAEDEEISLADDARVGIVHSLDLGESDAGKWGEVFGDYEILQPFTQLGRETYAIEESEKKELALARFRGKKVPTRAVIGLEARGWRRGPPMDGGIVGWMQKQLPNGACACLNLDPGLFTGYLDEEPEQTLDDLTVTRSAQSWDSRGQTPMGELSPVIFSELVRDVTQLSEA